MPPSQFESVDVCAGYFVARQTVRPESRERIPSALDALSRRDIELRVLDTLRPLRDAVLH